MNPNTICVGCMEQDSGAPICPVCGRLFDLEPRNSLQLTPRRLLHDQYLIGRALGHGGFGITYLAWDIALESRLAVKEYMPNGVAGRAPGDTKVLAFSEQTQREFEWGLDRFLEEARVLKQFNNHPGIVRVDTVFRDNGTAYLVMEYLDGVTLEEFLARRGGKITFETALRVLRPVLDALGDVHGDGILHRDISPDNIYLTKNGLVKLIDFGAARNALGQKSRNLSIILKEGYAPEEQYRASGIQGPWTDVYATAATFYHALTGRIPHASLDRLAEDHLPLPSQLGIPIPPYAEAALSKALSVRSVERFQSMEDFKAALTGAVDLSGANRVIPRQAAQLQPAVAVPAFQHGMPAPRPPLPPPPADSGGTPRWIWAAALGAAAILSLAAAMVVPRGGGGKKEQEKQVQQPQDQRQKRQDGNQNGGKQDGGNQDNGERREDQQQQQKQTQTQHQPQQKQYQQQDQGDPRRDRPQQNQQQQQQSEQQQQNPQDQKQNPQQPQQDYPRETKDQRAQDAPPVISGNYDGLVQQAKQVASRNSNQALQLLSQAIQLDPNKPQAYDASAEIQLYQQRQLGPAMQNYKKALERGGEATFHVFHDHRGTNFTSNCKGFLRISRGKARFEAFDSVHKFAASRVFEAKKNRFSLFTGGGNRSVDMHSFHIRLENKDGPNYNLAPMSQFGEAERDLILDVLDKK
jgi:serine/threonine protein kinase